MKSNKSEQPIKAAVMKLCYSRLRENQNRVVMCFPEGMMCWLRCFLLAVEKASYCTTELVFRYLPEVN